MTEELLAEQEGFIYGRGGLHMPLLECLTVHSTEFNEYSVLDFFHKLWNLNGFDTETLDRFYNPRAYEHELVIPAAGDKPTTVIRGTYRPNPNYARTKRGFTPDTRGTETHQLLLPPHQVGQFHTFLSVHQADEVGSRIASAGFSHPVISWHDKKINRPLSYYQSTDVESNTEVAIFEQTVKRLLKDTIELLT